jgi:hypothetical protein
MKITLPATLSKTFLAKSLVLALASMAVTIHNAHAIVTFDLRAVSATGGATVVNGGSGITQTSVVNNAVAGTVVTVNIWAQVTASAVGNGVFGFSQVVGGVASAQNGSSPFLVGALSTANLVQSPFTFSFANGTTGVNGTTGSTDIFGSSSSGASAPSSGWIQGLANTTSGGTSIGGYFMPTNAAPNGATVNNIGNGSTLFGYEFLIGITTYTVSSAANGSSIKLNWTVPAFSTTSTRAQRAAWTEGDNLVDQSTTAIPGNVATALVINAVPEPNTYAMMIGGLGMLVAFNRFRRKMA